MDVMGLRDISGYEVPTAWLVLCFKNQGSGYPYILLWNILFQGMCLYYSIELKIHNVPYAMKKGLLP